MSVKPIARNPDVQRLIDEGYEVEIQNQHLLVHSIPYVTPEKLISLGVLACPYQDDAKPNDHVVSFKGQMPCNSEGKPLSHLLLNTGAHTLFDQFTVQHQFSNKPISVPDFPSDYYVKMLHYIDLLVAQARVLDVNTDARTGRALPSREENPVFCYPDSASARAGIVAVSQKLRMQRIAIIGLGGTGSYIFDQVAKTPVVEIHLFDADDFKRHNAFRAPGAASLDQLQRRMKKVEYFREVYAPMRNGIICHPYHLDATNVDELEEFDFVFVAVDDGLSRKMICQYLCDSGIPFIDVGMGLEKADEVSSIFGICRITVGTQEKNDHLAGCLPVDDDKAEALYRSNIQVADMNAMNAVLAVIKWKQYCGFYVDYDRAHQITFSVSMQSIVRKEITGAAVA